MRLNGQDSLSVETDYWLDHYAKITNPASLSSQPFDTLSPDDKAPPRHAYYMRIKGANHGQYTIRRWLQVGVFDSLSIYHNQGSGDWQKEQKGLLVAYEPSKKSAFRRFETNKYGFWLEWPAGTTRTYYLRVRNTVRSESSLAHIHLLSPEERLSADPAKAMGFLIFNTIFFSIFLFFIAFSIIQYGQQGDRAYLYYAAYLGFAALYFWWKFEKANSFLNLIFTNYPQVYYYWEVPLSVLIYLSYCYFVVYFLNARSELPRLYHIIQLSSPLLLVFLGVHFLVVMRWGLPVGWELFYWLRLVLFPLGFVAIYQVFTTRHRLAFYILSGTTAMLIGGVITTIMSRTLNQHYLGYWDLPLLPIQLGMLIELLFFSTGLAYKGRLMAEEKLALQLDIQQQAKEAMQMRNRKQALTDLYARLSHEFRTPLTIIQSALARISGNAKEQELIQRYSKQVLQSVNQVMDLHKLESEKMEIDWVQGDVGSFIRYCTRPFALLAEQKGQQLQWQNDDFSLIMDFDEQKLSCILNNLLSNAIRHNPVGACIAVALTQVREGTQDFLTVAISDEGPGLTAEEQTSIFVAYQQGAHHNGGTGIGLTLAQEYSQLLGGHIKVASALGQGSTFTLCLPVHRQASPAQKWNKPTAIPAPTPPAYQPPRTVDTHRPTLLVAEDNEDVIWLLRALLQDRYNVLSAANGQQAWAQVLQSRPDLLVSDVMMPELDGLELCSRLRGHRFTQDIPVILLSAKASESDRLKGLKAGANAYLSKPFSEAELLLRIKTLLPEQSELDGRQTEQPPLATPSMMTEAESVAFLEKFHRVLLDNLSDPAFKVKDLCRELAINHVSLNKKIRNYTEQSTAQYVRNFRMHQARCLLEETKLTIAEVSYRVGISEAPNFGNLFRKTFGMSPGEWRRSLLEGRSSQKENNGD